MEILFTLDSKDYDESIEVICRPSARGVIIKDGKVAMIHSALYDYYKFPGGGIEEGETPIQAMIREVKEESGLTVIPESIRELGNIRRRSKTQRGGLFAQDYFYFVCSCEENAGETNLDDYESEEGFTLEFVNPNDAIKKNQNCNYEHKMPLMLKREIGVLLMLIEQGFFN